jgi:hypothetical protein
MKEFFKNIIIWRRYVVQILSLVKFLDFKRNKMNENIVFPPDSFPLEHQVAGHFSDKNNNKISMLGTIDGCVLKAIQSKQNGERELEFFQKIFNHNNDELSEHKIFLRKFLPYYIGYFDFNMSMYISLLFFIQTRNKTDFKSL